jgi:hypothetical protein
MYQDIAAGNDSSFRMPGQVRSLDRASVTPLPPLPSSGTPSQGRIVLYTLQTLEGLVSRPAMIVRVWSSLSDFPRGACNLQVFFDGQNDAADGDGPGITAAEAACGMGWRTSVHQADGPTEGCWHWPPRTP